MHDKGGEEMKSRVKLLGILVLAIVSAMLAPQTASAESTLEKILSAKKIRVAVDVANPPFGVLDKAGQPDGSDVAVGRQLPEGLGGGLHFVALPSTGRRSALVAGPAHVTLAPNSVTAPHRHGL